MKSPDVWHRLSHYRGIVAKTVGIVAVLTLPILVSSNIPPLYWIYLLLLLIYLTFAFSSVRRYLSQYRDAFTVIAILVTVLIFAVNRYEGDLRTQRIIAAENRFNYEQAQRAYGDPSATASFSLFSYRPNFDFILRRYGSMCANQYTNAVAIMDKGTSDGFLDEDSLDTLINLLTRILANCT